MKKLLSLFLVLTLALSVLPVGGQAFAQEAKTSKDLAIEVVQNPKVWKSLNKEEKEQIKEYAKKSEVIMKEIDKKAEKVNDAESKTKIFKQEFQQLNEEEQLAVIVYQTPVTIEVSEQTMHNEIYDAPVDEKKSNDKFSLNTVFESVFSLIETPKAHAYANRTNYFRKTLVGKNIWGKWLWEFWSSNNWTYDGIKVRAIDPKEGSKIHSSGWSYTGKSVESWYNYEGFDYHRNVEGYFKLSIGSTWQTATAYIDSRVRANGDWSAVTDVSGAYTN